MRVIPMADPASEASACGEESGEVRPVKLTPAQRDSLKGSGLLFGTLTTGTLLAGLAPSTACALELKKLSAAQGVALMAMGRVLYPHGKLPDAVHVLLAKDLEGKAAGAIRTPPYPGPHNLATSPMSARARDGVVNKWGQTHDISKLFVSDGSQFTTGGAENPTLTIVTLAIRQADDIAEQMAQRAI
jgi:choline dehydrogenase-like flavoprotein